MKKNLKQYVMITFLLGSLVIWLGLKWYEQYYTSTDDAYVNANIVQIAPRISGQITQLKIVNNQYVKKNQILLEIDPLPYQLALEKASAELQIARAKLENAILTAKRVDTLVSKKVISTQQGDNIHTLVETAQANVLLAKTNLKRAVLNLQYTKILAPTNGWISNASIRIGNMVTPNQPLFALISDGEFWVDANFKETALQNIHAGQRVDIAVDMYPKHAFKGIVDSISNGTGNAFSLFPAQNATGNWVKVTQRIPVRIRIQNLNPHLPLRIGSSANVRIHLTKLNETV